MRAVTCAIRRRRCEILALGTTPCSCSVERCTSREQAGASLPVWHLIEKQGGNIDVCIGRRSVEQDAEMMRLQLLGDPNLMNQLRQTNPEIVDAAQNNPAQFAELIRQTRQRQHEVQLEAERERMLLEADPFSIEAQRKIEEAIQQQAVLENLEHALEYSPESFGRVTMLYIPVEVNGHPVKAFVDSGAQSTISTCGVRSLSMSHLTLHIV
ncbi:aspartyl protease-domain-containing protein [Dichomitus squalens]|uniref:Aspartyl protease-domain-containing protein n=1 Tax=Dichomitus squalens TaxID=114155 RepID=A0A4Q9PVX2_9APHY|nr:aspartyl protease-domain-containing protein [Dichomitus squalens]